MRDDRYTDEEYARMHAIERRAEDLVSTYHDELTDYIVIENPEYSDKISIAAAKVYSELPKVLQDIFDEFAEEKATKELDQ